jgi:hypothetical protein
MADDRADISPMQNNRAVKAKNIFTAFFRRQPQGGETALSRGQSWHIHPECFTLGWLRNTGAMS